MRRKLLTHYRQVTYPIIAATVLLFAPGCLGAAPDPGAIDDSESEGVDLPDKAGARTQQKCATAAANQAIALSCPFGWVIQSIDWASYGLPSGSCPTFTANTSCHMDARSRLSSCVGQSSCNSVKADNQTFGNPCPTSTWPKKLAVKYTCREDTTKFVLQDFVGQYERSPVLNDWHKVDITLANNALRWKNAAGTSWALSYVNGVLKTGADCPYGVKEIDIEKKSGTNAIETLIFNDRFVRKSPGPISTCAKPQVSLIPPAQGFSFKTNETVVFQARVSDDRTASASLKVEWRSDLYGLIGTEPPASDGVLRHTFAEPAVGSHNIELSVTDSDCGTTKQSFKVTFACPAGAPFCPEPFIVNGPPSKRTNLLFMGDGYTATEQAKFRTYVTSAMAFMFGDQNPPYKRYTEYYNIWILPLVSRQSGADDTKKGIEIDTPLDGNVDCANWNGDCAARGDCDCMANWGIVGDVSTKTFQAGLPTAGLPSVERNMTEVILNTESWGGGAHGPPWGRLTVQAARPATGVEAFYVLTHELGHQMHRFADWGNPGQSDTKRFPDAELESRDTSKDPSGNKWSEWRGAPQPDNERMRGEPSPIGAYPGCCYVYSQGIYRPSRDSRMWFIEYPFDRFQRQLVIQDIYKWTRPIDASFPSSLQLKLGETASVQIVDPTVQQIIWTLDGKQVGNGGNSFNTSSSGNLTRGAHTLTATVHDRVLDNALTNNPLDLVRKGGEAMTQTVTFVLQVP